MWKYHFFSLHFVEIRNSTHKTNNISRNFAITAAAKLKALNNSDTYQMSACDKDIVVDTGGERVKSIFPLRKINNCKVHWIYFDVLFLLSLFFVQKKRCKAYKKCRVRKGDTFWGVFKFEKCRGFKINNI